MKPRLIILSDLWGKEKSDWVSYYVEQLKDKFEIQFYDCCELGAIDKTNYTEASLHLQFVNGGIETGIENLLEAEKKQIDVLAFSIGGTIAWKAALRGLDVRNLVATSSTRLRYEEDIPSGVIKLYYGENDSNTPSSNWFAKHAINYKIIKNMGHNFYTQNEFVASICNEILN